MGILETTWNRLRKLYPRRLYQYGTNGLSIFDDRSLTERIFDRIDDYFTDKRIEERQRLYNKGLRFNRFFDWSLGRWIDSREQIKQIERERGMTYIDCRDWEIEHKKRGKYREEAHLRQIERGLKSIMHDIGQGRSFVKEKKEYNAKIMKEHGIKRIPKLS